MTKRQIERESKSDATRRRIIEAGAHILKKRGLAGAKLTEIAAEAGTFAGSLYYYFESKERLVEEVMLEGMARNARHIQETVAATGPKSAPIDKLRAAVFAHIEFLLQGDECSSAVARVFNDLPDDIRRRVVAAYTAFENIWRDLIQACQRSYPVNSQLDVTIVRLLLLGMMKTAPDWYRQGRMTTEEIAQQVWILFTAGFLPAAATLDPQPTSP